MPHSRCSTLPIDKWPSRLKLFIKSWPTRCPLIRKSPDYPFVLSSPYCLTSLGRSLCRIVRYPVGATPPFPNRRSSMLFCCLECCSYASAVACAPLVGGIGGFSIGRADPLPNGLFSSLKWKTYSLLSAVCAGCQLLPAAPFPCSVVPIPKRGHSSGLAAWLG